MRVVLLVLDGLGIGEMSDVPRLRPQDKDSNTLVSIAKQVADLSLPNLASFGLGNLVSVPSLPPLGRGALASYGRCRLAHQGADSYLGHQEIMGTIPEPPLTMLVGQVAGELQRRLEEHGYHVVRPLDGKELLLVEGAIVIGDNLEADAGQNINLTVATDQVDFEKAEQIGQVVRQAVKVARIIVFGGPGITVADILAQVKERPNGQIGVDSPALGVYDDNLQVRHMGYGVDPARQVTSILSRAGMAVALIGKMADVITCPGALKQPFVATSQVMSAIHEYIAEMRAGLIAATVQETDLAAHEGDAFRMAKVLEQADQGIGALLPLMREDDVLIVCADHGNDPLVNVGLHTREETPLLVYQPRRPAQPLGIRDTLADIGATVADCFGVSAPQDGAPVF